MRWHGTGLRGQGIGVVGDVGRVDPLDPPRLDGKVEQVLFHRGDEIGRALRRHWKRGSNSLGRRGLVRDSRRGKPRGEREQGNGSKNLHISGNPLVEKPVSDATGLNLQHG